MATGLDSLDTSLQKTNEYFVKIEDRLGWQGRRDQTYLAVKTILHRLRDHLPVNESANFAAQLPMILRGVYFDSWQPRDKPLRESGEKFINAIEQQFQYSVEDIKEVITTVIDETFRLVGEGEANKIIKILPEELARIICC